MSDMPLALVGADTFAGESVLSLLADTGLVENLVALGAAPEDDATVSFGGQTLQIEKLTDYRFPAGQVVICAGDAAMAETAIQAAGSAGAMVLDATGFSRGQDYVSLVHPDINPEALMSIQQNGVVAVPGDIAMPVAPILRVLRQLGDIGRVDMTCCLSVSSAGRKGVSEMASQTNRLLNGLPAQHEVFSDQISFNMLPAVAGNIGDAVTVARELAAVSGHDALPVHVSSIMTPVFYGQAVQLSVTMDWGVSVHEAWEMLEGVPELRVVNDPEEVVSPVSLANADEEHRRQIHICGLQASEVQDNVLTMWVICDSARTGSASGAVKLYDLLSRGGW